MSFGWDPEVPTGFQDADIEMAEMRERANEAYEQELADRENDDEAIEARRLYVEEK